jgi:hypothetical protein
MADIHPTYGARIVLERESHEGPHARYRVSIHEPEITHEAVADFDASGALTLGAWSTTPPAWALTFTERLLKGLPKKHADDASWPRKLVRWREERG